MAAIHLHTTIFFCYSVSILWLKIKACHRCTEMYKETFSFKVKVLVAQSCPILCSPIDCSPPGPSVHGILQARILKWVAMPFSRGSSRPRDRIPISQSPALAGGFFTTSATWEAHKAIILQFKKTKRVKFAKKDKHWW